MVFYVVLLPTAFYFLSYGAGAVDYLEWIARHVFWHIEHICHDNFCTMYHFKMFWYVGHVDHAILCGT